MYGTLRGNAYPHPADFPFTERETENIGHAAGNAMRRAERAVRNWPNPAYHQVFDEAWEMIEDLYEELVFFCPSPPLIQIFSDWMVYNRELQVRHLNALLAAHERRRQQSRVLNVAHRDHLAMARQRRVELAQQHCTTAGQNMMNEHRDRIAAWQQETAAVRGPASVSSPAPSVRSPAPTSIAPVTANAPISVEEFSGILNSNSSTAVGSNPRFAHQPTVEDATDDEFAPRTNRPTRPLW
jgi:hypothetical protein